ncbi:universal stress protein [Verrucomicrobiales bacterium]|nr:universal stress protein [Verrucomicrobiales bacterium]
MKRFKNILIYLPAPGTSPEIFEWCRKITERSEPESVDVAHFLGEILPEYPGGTPADEAVSVEKELVEKIVEEQLPGVPTNVIVDSGEPLRGLLELLVKGSYDLVLVPVADKQGRGFVERLVRKSPAGVLIVPAGCTPNLKRLRVAVDFSELSPLAMKWAEAFASIGETTPALEALHVMQMPAGSRATAAIEPGHLRAQIHQTSTEALKNFLEENAATPGSWKATVEEHGLSWMKILEEEEGENDLLVIGSHGRGAFSVALLGSQSAEIIREVQRPVLVVKQKNQTLGFLRQLVGLDP